MGLVIESHTSPASARRRVLRRIALAACSPRRPRAPRPSPGRAQAPLPDSDGAGLRVSRQDRVDEERAGADRVRIAGIEHHALAPTQRQHRVAHRRQRCPLPDLRSERYYVGRRPCDWQVSVVTGAEVEPLAHTGYRSDATFDWGDLTAGALELAFALLACSTGGRPPDPICEMSQSDVIARLDRAGSVLGDDALDRAPRRRQAADSRGVRPPDPARGGRVDGRGRAIATQLTR